MPSTDLTTRILVEGGDKAESQIEGVADAADELDKKEHVVRFRGDTEKVARDIDDVLTKVDKLQGTDAAKLMLTSNATEMYKEIGDLVLEIQELDAQDPNIEIKAQNIADLEGGLDRLSAKAKEITGQDLTLRTESGRKGLDDIVTGADQANSAVANMVGNAAQDMGELGGITGSAGVAVGQLAEYFTDAAYKARDAGQGIGAIFKSFAGAAGPIAAVGVGIAVVSSAMEQIQKIRAFRTEDAEAWADAIKGATDNVEALTQHLQEIGKVQVTAGGVFGTDWQAEIQDVTEQIDRAGLTYEQFIALVNSEVADPGSIDRWRESMERANGETYATSAVADAAHQKVKQLTDATAEQERQTRLSALSTEGATRAVENYLQTQDSLNQTPDLWQQVADAVGRVNQGLPVTAEETAAINQIMRDTGMTQEQVLQQGAQLWEDNQQAAADAAAAAQEYAQVLASSDWGASTVASAATAWGELLGAQNALTNINAGVQESYDNLNQSIKDNGFTFDVATEKGRANAQVVQQLGQSLIPQLSAAFADSGGNVDTFAANMDRLRSDVFAGLDSQTSLTADQINAVIDQLGVFDGSTYSSTFEMLGVEDANAKLALLSGVIGSLPPEVQQQVTMDVIAGDPQAALDHIKAAVGAPGAAGTATIETDVSTNPALVKAGSLVAQIGSMDALMQVGANTAPGTKDVQTMKATTDKTEGTVQVDANTKQAIATMMYLRILAALLQPVVTVTANTGPAVEGLNAVQRLRPMVPVTAFLASAPSAGSIANSIGTVRVPIDAYVRTMPRITGTL